jgi:hypothetical protein
VSIPISILVERFGDFLRNQNGLAAKLSASGLLQQNQSLPYVVFQDKDECHFANINLQWILGGDVLEIGYQHFRQIL